jgi:hypothetical protein
MTVIVLDEPLLDAAIREMPLVPGFEEEAAWVTEYPGLDQDDFRQTCRLELHAQSSSSPQQVSAVRDPGQRLRQPLELAGVDES